MFEALEAVPSSGLRVRQRDGPVQVLTRQLGWASRPLPWSPEGVLLEPWPDGPPHPATRHTWQEAGSYYLQDPSAMAVVPVLDPQPGERVLDLAAAPGGKSTYIADRLEGRGLLWSHDAEAGRVDALVGNLERWGVAGAVVSQGPVSLLAPLRAGFDRVLLDAPCSGEGMFRKSAAARLRWTPERVLGLAGLQDRLLDQAADLLRPGGVLVYATCTFAVSENEGAVARLLARRDDMRPEAIHVPGSSPAILPAGAPAELAAACARWWPHRQDGEGHFVARLRRDREAEVMAPVSRPARRREPETRDEPAGRGDLDVYRAFADEVLGGGPELPGPFRRLGDWLWAWPEDMPDTPLRPRRTGVPLGRVRRGRFEPHHALSRLPISAGGASVGLDLPIGDPRLSAYLRGEVIEATVTDGWQLVQAAGQALGWAKAKAGVLNNHYPKGLRLG